MIIGKLDLKKIGARLRITDRFLLHVLKTRVSHGGLSGCVAESKRKGTKDGIFTTRRQDVEDRRIELAKKWARQDGLDPNFAASFQYKIMSESSKVQNEIMIAEYQRQEAIINEDDPDAVYACQRSNLLRLTKKIAPDYDKSYGEGFFGSKSYFAFEKNIISKLIQRIPHDGLAIDLGCATGIISFEVADAFDRVFGYEICPTMIEYANSKKTEKNSNITFFNSDIEEGLNLPKNSVSLAIMNMGTASEIKNFKNFLDNLHECLKPGGKFFLSFYNAESLLSKIGFIPWPTPLAASIDAEKRCLEVQYDNELYFLYARPRGIAEFESLFTNFKVDEISTFPTLSSLLPSVLLENEDENGIVHANGEVQELLRKIDSELSISALNTGTYIIVTGEKK